MYVSVTPLGRRYDFSGTSLDTPFLDFRGGYLSFLGSGELLVSFSNFRLGGMFSSEVHYDVETGCRTNVDVTSGILS